MNDDVSKWRRGSNVNTRMMEIGDFFIQAERSLRREEIPTSFQSCLRYEGCNPWYIARFLLVSI
jgi:hypothetical protein